MNSLSSHFEGVLDRYFEEVLADQPIFATYSGLPHGEGKLGRTGAAFQTRLEKRRRRTLVALNRINPRELSNEQQLDRLALRSQLLRECEDFQRGRHTLDPSAVDQLLNLLLHELQRGEDEPARAAKNVRSILRLAPTYLNEASTLVTSPETLWVNRAFDPSSPPLGNQSDSRCARPPTSADTAATEPRLVQT